MLAGTGFRTDPAAHAEVQELFGVLVISLRLVDPRFYHPDTALAVLDDSTVAYYPEAFTPGSRGVLQRLVPDAILAGEADAVVRAGPSRRSRRRASTCSSTCPGVLVGLVSGRLERFCSPAMPSARQRCYHL